MSMDDIGLERSFIAALLRDPSGVFLVTGAIEPDELAQKEHGATLAAMFTLADAGRPVTIHGIAEVIHDLPNRKLVSGFDDAASAREFLFALANHLDEPVSDLIDAARSLSRLARARGIALAAQRIIHNYGRAGMSPEGLLDIAKTSLETICAPRDTDGGVWLSEAMDAASDALERAYEHPEKPDGLSTGLLALDRVASLRNSSLTVLAGKTAFGKTSLATGIALATIFDESHDPGTKNVLFFSMEMSRDQLVARVQATMSSVENHLIRNGRHAPLRVEQLESIRRSGNLVATARQRCMLLPIAGVTLRELAARARRMKKQHGVGLIIVDYVQLIRPESGSKSSREQEVAQATRGLKNLAMELDVPVLALSQLNRASEEKDEPELRDLRESGEIEQAADNVWIIWPAKARRNEPEPPADSARVFVLKHRDGPTGSCLVRFARSLTRFEDVRRQDEYDYGNEAPIPLD